MLNCGVALAERGAADYAREARQWLERAAASDEADVAAAAREALADAGTPGE
jgi:hypothetical protein